MSVQNLWLNKYNEKQLELIAQVDIGLRKIKDPRAQDLISEFFDVFENHKNQTPVYRKIRGSLVKDAYAAAQSRLHNIENKIGTLSNATLLTTIQASLVGIQAGARDETKAENEYYYSVLKGMNYEIPKHNAAYPKTAYLAMMGGETDKATKSAESLIKLLDDISALHSETSIIASPAEEAQLNKGNRGRGG